MERSASAAAWSRLNGDGRDTIASCRPRGPRRSRLPPSLPPLGSRHGVFGMASGPVSLPSIDEDVHLDALRTTDDLPACLNGPLRPEGRSIAGRPDKPREGSDYQRSSR